MELYENIKKCRLKLNLTQQQLADLTGYGDRSSIAKIENGLVDLSQSKLELFAKVLHVSPGELMGDVTEISEPSFEQADPAEEHLLSTFRQLNDEGQEKLVDYADDLAASGRYKKGNSFEVVEEEA